MKRVWLLALGMFVFCTAAYLVADALGYADEAVARGWLEGLRGSAGGRWLAAGAVVFLLLIDLLLPVPSSFVMVFAGVALGWFWGGLASFAGSYGASLIGFHACRRWGARAFERLVGADAERARAWFERSGVLAVILSRSLPMLTEILSCLAGLSKMRAGLFWAASACGTLPVCFLYSIAGSRGESGAPYWAVLAAMGVPALAWLLTRFVLRRGRKISTIVDSR